MNRSTSILIALILLAAASTGRAADPSVARPSFPIEGEIQTRGIVFFVEASGPAKAAAVGTAHTFDLAKLVRVKRGELLLGGSRRVAARTSGFLAEPGRPFTEPGATLAGDFVIYALDAPPQGVRALRLSSGKPPAPGSRVRVVGIPDAGGDEQTVFGKVAEVSAERLEVDLDSNYELRGWGGAPVVDDASGAVIGMLQAYFPRRDTARVIASPVDAMRAALARPLDGGMGRVFSRFADDVRERGRAAAKPGDGKPGTAKEAAARHEGPLIRQTSEDGTRVHLDIEYPPDGAVVGSSACGTFVAGRAIALQGELRQFDVMLVIDTSKSTTDPTGADINGNGIVGKPYLGRVGSMFDIGSTDPGDSILAAEVAGARQLLHGFDPRSTRVGLVVFSGDMPDGQGGLFVRGPRAPAITLEPLTEDYARVEAALDDVLARDPEGATHMAAGVDQATIELMGLRGALSRPNPRAEKVVLFFTDGQPTLPYGPGFDADNVRAVLRAANRAERAEVRIHSFAIGPEALDGPVATVEMAQRTDGYFTPVRHPGDLVDVVEEVSFANLDAVALRSITTGKEAEMFRATADGSWAGFVRMEPGRNELEIQARATDGTEAKRRIAVTMADEAPEPPVPSDMVVARNRLLEDCLRSIKQVRMDAEREQAEQVRKSLMVEIEKERAEARKRSEDQRKRLELEAGDEGTGEE